VDDSGVMYFIFSDCVISSAIPGLEFVYFWGHLKSTASCSCEAESSGVGVLQGMLFLLHTHIRGDYRQQMESDIY
jgi:hypothetical protein